MPDKLVFRTEDKSVDDFIEFTVEGKTLDGEEWSETFQALPRIPAGVLDDLTAYATMDALGNVMFSQPFITAFFEKVLVDGDGERFTDMVHDRERLVDIELLGKIMDALGEKIGGLPFASSSVSTGGRSSGRTTPKAQRSKRR
jgi:hypothetical protein